MKEITINPIGEIRSGECEQVIAIDEAYRAGLRGLEGFSHLIVLWWASGADEPEYRTLLDAGMPYRKVKAPLGIFATRSPIRPNPVCASVVDVADLDIERGCVSTYYIDAEPGTPVIDIKPYAPSIDRVASPSVPAWCDHWPADVETSGDFNWDAEFTF